MKNCHLRRKSIDGGGSTLRGAINIKRIVILSLELSKNKKKKDKDIDHSVVKKMSIPFFRICGKCFSS
jgi:hypothetical protein